MSRVKTDGQIKLHKRQNWHLKTLGMARAYCSLLSVLIELSIAIPFCDHR